jgi:hypothetical protein
MHPTLVTTALGRRGRHVLAVTLAAAGVSGALADGAQAAQVPPRCEIVACPDLTISRVEKGPNGDFYVTVRNIGLRRAAGSHLGWQMHPQSAFGGWVMVLALNPGEAYRTTVDGDRCAAGVRLTFVADHDQGVTESNEHNNRYTYAC